ncbi:MAG: hypothetical protein Q9182_007242, partial [Xanthomendoza sp. 2 TL-2023]
VLWRFLVRAIKPNYSNADFDEQCGEMIKETRKAKRILIGIRKSVRDQYGLSHDNHPDIVAAKEQFTTTRNAKKHLVRKTMNQVHRTAMASTVADPDKISKIAKRVNNRRNPYSPFTPNLNLTDGTTITTKTGKAETLARSCFPIPREADLDDTENYQYPTPISMPEITEPEILRAINNAANGKQSGDDEIPNEILKRTLDVTLPHVKKISTPAWN